jgi:alcohol dehydrogenase class IV
VRNLRTEVGIPDHSDKLKREDFDAIAELAIAEGDGYPVPRLLDKPSILAILGKIAG